MLIRDSFLAWFKEQQRDYQAILFDIDGTITLGPNPLPGNIETIDFLRSTGFPFLFLTNDGISSHSKKCRQLKAGGIICAEEDIVSSADALTSEIKRQHLVGATALLLGEPGGQTEYLEIAGLLPVDISKLDQCQVIFIGEGKFDWYNDIQKVINFLRFRPNFPIVIANPDAVWTGYADRRIGVGAGGIARFIENIMRELGVQVNMTFLGKPNPGIYLATLERLEQRFGLKAKDRRKIIMAGDALFSDICGANRIGMTSVLMMTGLTTKQILADASGDFMPQLAFQHLA